MSVPFAERTKRLGTETAFAVGAEAASLAATGVKVYPFTWEILTSLPRNTSWRQPTGNQGRQDGLLSHPGITPLREAMAEEIYRTRGFKIDADNVSIQTGGKPVIGKFIMTLMNPGDEVLYPNRGSPSMNR